jgi:hypothetical protein
MQKTALTLFGTLLISGITVQMAAASEHHRSKAYFGRDLSEFRRAYNLVNGPINVTLRHLAEFPGCPISPPSPVCTENLIRVDDVTETPKLAGG